VGEVEAEAVAAVDRASTGEAAETIDKTSVGWREVALVEDVTISRLHSTSDRQRFLMSGSTIYMKVALELPDVVQHEVAQDGQLAWGGSLRNLSSLTLTLVSTTMT
jgi:hypothetical protein